MHLNLYTKNKQKLNLFFLIFHFLSVHLIRTLYFLSISFIYIQFALMFIFPFLLFLFVFHHTFFWIKILQCVFFVCFYFGFLYFVYFLLSFHTWIFHLSFEIYFGIVECVWREKYHNYIDKCCMRSGNGKLPVVIFYFTFLSIRVFVSIHNFLNDYIFFLLVILVHKIFEFSIQSVFDICSCWRIAWF